MYRTSLYLMSILGILVSLAGCPNKEDSPDGGGVGLNPPSADLSGTWTVNDTVNSNCASGNGPREPYTITIAQSVNSLTVVTPQGTFNGTINGDTVNWSGNYDDNGGKVTITSLRVTIASGGNSFSGTSTWTWTDNSKSCTGSTAINAVRSSTGGQLPAAPTNAAAQALSTTSIQITWTDQSNNESSFVLERSTISAASGFAPLPVIIAADTQSYTNTGLTPSTTYWYRVRARGVAGDSAPSNTVFATTQAASGQAPLPPTHLQVTVTATPSVQLTWNDASNNETGFKIERSTTSSSTGYSQITQTAADTTAYTDTSVVASTTYYYRVSAVNAAGSSAYSNVATATTAAGVTPPAAPSALSATALSSSSIRIDWTDNSNNESGFAVERASSCTGTFSQVYATSANIQSYTDTGLTASTFYCYRVRAFNSAGNSNYSATASATTLAVAICTAQESRCVAGNISVVESCNSGGTAWVRSNCPNWSLCSNRSCRTICGITSTPANPTVCTVPNKDNVNNGEWTTWYDNRLAVPTYITARSMTGSGGYAPIYSASRSWPYAWSISSQDVVGVNFRLNQFGAGYRDPRLSFAAKRAGIITTATNNYMVGIFNGSTALGSCVWGPISYNWETTSCHASSSLYPLFSYTGGWNGMLLSITGDGFGGAIDLLDVNYIYLTIEPPL